MLKSFPQHIIRTSRLFGMVQRYRKPMDMLLSRRFRTIFLQAIPQLEERSPVLGQALEKLGVPSDSQGPTLAKAFCLV